VIIKILLISAALGVAVLVLREKVPRQQEATRRAAGLLVVLAGIIAVLWPDLTTKAANAVGVGRGTDLVLYLLVTVFAYSALTTTQKIHRLQHDITVLTRELALLQPARSGGGELLPRPDAGSAVGSTAERDRS
jgi:small membrane protein